MISYWIAIIFGILGGFMLGWWKSIRRVPKPYRNFRYYSFKYKNPNKEEAIREWNEATCNLHRNKE